MSFSDARMIPVRGDEWSLACARYREQERALGTKVDFEDKIYKSRLYRACFDQELPATDRVLTFPSKAPRQKYRTILGVYFEQQGILEREKCIANVRATLLKPTKVLDAPDLVDEYCLHVMDAPKKSRTKKTDNRLAIALSHEVYTTILDSNLIDKVATAENRAIITCLRWLHPQDQLLLAANDTSWKIVDIATKRKICNASLSSCVLCAEPLDATTSLLGMFDGTIVHKDVREPLTTNKISRHSLQRICSLALNSDGYTLASGSGDNSIKLWDIRREGCLNTFKEHHSAVRALAWAPWKSSLLFSGGGQCDQTVKAIDVQQAKLIACETSIKSPVSAIHVSAESNQLVSCYGAPSNGAIVWKFDNKFHERAKLEGHAGCILQSTMLADDQTLVTAGADEVIRVWNAFEKKKSLVAQRTSALTLPTLR